MTTVHTSYDKYRWLLLPFSITSAPDEFHMRLTSALEGLDGMICIVDGILVYREGNNVENGQADHDRCHQRSMKLNAGKLRFKVKEVKFMGTIT